ncbi:hypothetical protein Bca52824_023079 [Brassica carinata]|uniref:Replication protein A 70 kDa DNA-binding subunit B/D first OB fold domain-containing protein n=1 Tax=Brassica carinata TaxID=52824 RepID=A0A8X7VHW6_BRACI|nr:hypothetical protein Bca52824_023079 [Brassica carinata]
MDHILGALVSVGNLKWEFSQVVGTEYLKPISLISFTLTDIENNRVRCVAYETMAEHLNTFWSYYADGIVICLLRFWIEVIDGGYRQITNIPGCSEIKFNPLIEPVTTFKTMLKLHKLLRILKSKFMERNNTRILDLTESSKDVEVWAKIQRVWEMKSAPNEIERHLIVSDPKGYRIEMIVHNSLCQKHYFGSFDENQWKVFRRFEVRPCDGFVRNTPHQFQIIFNDRTHVFYGYSLTENPMFVPVPFQQVLQRGFDNTYPIVTSFGTLIESEDDPYEEMFCVPLTQINFKLKDESGCELECEALGEVAKELDMKSWWLSKYEKTFLALRFWRVQYLEEGRVKITNGGPCSKFEFDPTWI